MSFERSAYLLFTRIKSKVPYVYPQCIILSCDRRQLAASTCIGGDNHPFWVLTTSSTSVAVLTTFVCGSNRCSKPDGRHGAGTGPWCPTVTHAGGRLRGHQRGETGGGHQAQGTLQASLSRGVNQGRVGRGAGQGPAPGPPAGGGSVNPVFLVETGGSGTTPETQTQRLDRSVGTPALMFRFWPIGKLEARGGQR